MCASPHFLLPNVSFQECVSGSWSQTPKYGGELATGTPQLTTRPSCHSQGLLWQVSPFYLQTLVSGIICVLCRLHPCTLMYWMNSARESPQLKPIFNKTGVPFKYINLLISWDSLASVSESEILMQISVSDQMTSSGEIIAIGKLLLL